MNAELRFVSVQNREDSRTFNQHLDFDDPRTRKSVYQLLERQLDEPKKRDDGPANWVETALEEQMSFQQKITTP